MEKTVILLATAAIILGLAIAILSISLSSAENLPFNSNNQNLHAWTKAVCDKDNFCQDYFIECKGETPTKISPLTGAFIQFDNSWQDPRNIKQKERLCE